MIEQEAVITVTNENPCQLNNDWVKDFSKSLAIKKEKFSGCDQNRTYKLKQKWYTRRGYTKSQEILPPLALSIFEKKTTRSLLC